MDDKALREQVDEIVDKHRHFCTQADMFTGLSDVQTSHAIMQLILQDRERAVKEARLDELKQLWNNTQHSIVPEGAKAEDMSAELHNRIAQLSNPTQAKDK